MREPALGSSLLTRRPSFRLALDRTSEYGCILNMGV